VWPTHEVEGDREGVEGNDGVPGGGEESSASLRLCKYIYLIRSAPRHGKLIHSYMLELFTFTSDILDRHATPRHWEGRKDLGGQEEGSGSRNGWMEGVINIIIKFTQRHKSRQKVHSEPNKLWKLIYAVNFFLSH